MSPRRNGEIFNIGNTQEITHPRTRADHSPPGGVRRGSAQIKLVPYESFTGKRYEDVRRRVPDVHPCERMLGVNAKVGSSRAVREPSSGSARLHAEAIGDMTDAASWQRIVQIAIIGGGLTGLALAERCA